MRGNGQTLTNGGQNPGVTTGSGSPRRNGKLPAQESLETTVLVAVESAQVREALVAILGAQEGFRIVAEAASDDAALEAARNHRPHLALIEPELSGCGGWWAIQKMRAEQLVDVVVALGRRANDSMAHLAGAHGYVQIGAAPRDLLSALEAAMAARRPPVSGVSQAEGDLLPHTNPVIDKPAFIDL